MNTQELYAMKRLQAQQGMPPQGPQMPPRPMGQPSPGMAGGNVGNLMPAAQNMWQMLNAGGYNQQVPQASNQMMQPGAQQLFQNLMQSRQGLSMGAPPGGMPAGKDPNFGMGGLGPGTQRPAYGGGAYQPPVADIGPPSQPHYGAPPPGYFPGTGRPNMPGMLPPGVRKPFQPYDPSSGITDPGWGGGGGPRPYLPHGPEGPGGGTMPTRYPDLGPGFAPGGLHQMPYDPTRGDTGQGGIPYGFGMNPQQPQQRPGPPWWYDGSGAY
jgi:hypothetical protein